MPPLTSSPPSFAAVQSVTEKDMQGNMDYMAAHLLTYGYSIATVDYYCQPGVPGGGAGLEGGEETATDRMVVCAVCGAVCGCCGAV